MTVIHEPWLVTVMDTGTLATTSYGPLAKDGAVELRDALRAAVGPARSVEAWYAQSPNLRLVKSPEDAWIDVAA